METLVRQHPERTLPTFAAERAAALSEQDARIADADEVISRIDNVWRGSLETISRLRPNTWQYKLVPVSHRILGEVVALGTDLLRALDVTSGDLLDGRRAAITVGTDEEFAHTLTMLLKQVDLHDAKSRAVARTASEIQKRLVGLSDLLASGQLFASVFTVPPVAQFGFTAEPSARR
jgi:hypothetical protein